MAKYTPLLLALGCFFIFVFTSILEKRQQPHKAENIVLERVVLSPVLQILLNGGDPFLAANLELMRVSSTWSGDMAAAGVDARFRLRAYKLVSEMNPCHEDSYYQANALLAWEGGAADANTILTRATKCRFWDEFPPFFLGFNRLYFFDDSIGASKAFRQAANRSIGNKSVFKRLAIMSIVESARSEADALSMLKKEVEKSRDPALRKMLEKRVARIEGLLFLRDAQKQYEQKFKSGLTSPEQLIFAGIVSSFPSDPTGVGYEFLNGKFQLKTPQYSQ
ncbi:hypothetical protein [Chitinolyticbacter albus]|uniref:hypothetical protein n=1 Tax=Chitinolyticbacter albus TaxID=2961951 RepID=UPI00210DEE4E|nr:hypothetical protein [Chitinolyticbacter albus]